MPDFVGVTVRLEDVAKAIQRAVVAARSALEALKPSSATAKRQRQAAVKETRGAEDFRLLRRYRDDGNPRVRARTGRGLYRLAPTHDGWSDCECGAQFAGAANTDARTLVTIFLLSASIFKGIFDIAAADCIDAGRCNKERT